MVEGGAEYVGTIGLYYTCNILQRIIFDGYAHDDDATGSFDRTCLRKTINDVDECEQPAVLTIFVDDRYNVEAFEGDKFKCIVDVLRVEDELFAIRQTELSKRERLVSTFHEFGFGNDSNKLHPVNYGKMIEVERLHPLQGTHGSVGDFERWDEIFYIIFCNHYSDAKKIFSGGKHTTFALHIKMKMMHCKLSVNINKIATLRNARGGNLPDVMKAAADLELFGAEGITVHPRPDERHIRYDDVRRLKDVVKTEFNIEGYPSESFLKLVEGVNPQQVTLVPDPPDVLTSNAGWDAVKHQQFLRDTVARLRQNGMRVSLFMDTDLRQIDAAATTGAHRIELYTERYAAHFAQDAARAVSDYAAAGRHAGELQLGVNAGHDLNLENLRFLLEAVPEIVEVSIGHALISDALYYGLQNTVQMYKHEIRLARFSEK